jgi:threonine/homoserine/homoserine lactone efflux protein
MLSIPETLVLAFLIGLTGALAPGPTLVATIQASLRGGWTVGPKVTLGHMVVETLVFTLILLGVSATAVRFSDTIALIGGSALALFGILTLKESRDPRISLESSTPVGNPYLAGVITGIANPYFWIWWLTIGSALVVEALEGGIVLAITFMVGHWGADAGWLTFISTGIHRGRAFLTSRSYPWILCLCGIFLIGFGIYYATGAIL